MENSNYQKGYLSISQTLKRANLARIFSNQLNLKAVGSLLVLLLTVIAVTAQNTKNTDYSPDKSLKSNARVNPSTLAMEMSVPIAGYPGRAGNGLPVSFDYSSKVWEIEAFNTFEHTLYGVLTDAQPIYAKRTAAGWSSNLGSPRIDYKSDVYDGSDNPSTQSGGYIGQIHSFYEPLGGSPPYAYNLYSVKRLHVEMPDGSSHEFRADDTVTLCGTTTNGCAQDLPGTYLSVDGSKMRLEMNTNGTAILYMPDGSRYDFASGNQQAQSFTDRHGNKMTYNTANRQWTDNLERVVTNPFPNNWGTQNQTVGDVTASFPGLNNGTVNATFSWRYLKDPNNGESGLDDTNQTLLYPSVSYCNGNGTSGVSGAYIFDRLENQIRICGPNATFNPIVLTKITLANGQSYQFKYNLHGEIIKIIYPSGGYERFAYAQIPPVQIGSASYDQANRGVTDRWVSAKGDGTDEQHWTYSASRGTAPNYTAYTVTTTNPDGTRTEQLLHDENNPNVQRPYGFDNQKTGRPYETRAYSSTNQLLRRTLTKYEVTGAHTGGYSGATRDIRPVKEISLTFEPNASSALASMSETVYDTNSDAQYFASLNPKQSKTYHYVAVDQTTAQTANVDTIAALFSSSNLANSSETDYLYDANYKARNIVTLPTETRVKDAGGNVQAKSQVAYDEGTYPIVSAGTDAMWTDPGTGYRANPTTARSWTDIANNLYIETHAQFDNFGNLRKSWDAKGNVSETEYASTYKYAYPTKVISAIPDATGANGSSTAFETTSTYDLTTGLPLTTTDANGQTTTMEYNDTLLRPTKVTPPSAAGQTVMEYTDTPGAISVKTKSQIDQTNWEEETEYYDGIGRKIKTQVKDDQGDKFSEIVYDNMGRVWKTTNPYRQGDTKQWTEKQYDDLGRLKNSITPDGGQMQSEFGLATSGNQIGATVIVTDQAGKKRRSVSNALEQIIRVDEPNDSGDLGAVDNPNQPTIYSYDESDNLTHVVQGGQTRMFTYDALDRLKSAVNPESGTVTYSYDANSNLIGKIDARSVATTITYDALNRPKSKTYSDGTPAISYFYDSASVALSKGRLTKTSNSNSTSEYTGFDALGRILSSKQTTDGQNYTMSYSYDLGGNLLEETYPSGRKVKNTFDADADLSKVETQAAGGNYQARAENFSYAASGSVASVKLGNNRWESTVLNQTLQPTQIALGTTQNAADLLKLEYAYGTTDNNGNIKSQTITVPNGFTAVQNYTYDSLNRLKSATETQNSNQTWKQTFTYDRFGNRQFDASSTTTLGSCQAAQCNPTIDTANNRFTTAQGYTYDLSGNLTKDAENRKYLFDAEHKQTELQDATTNQTKATYAYDGDGRRVKKTVAATDEQTIFVYDADGDLAAEYLLTIATPQTPSTQYLTNDNLGSPRIITDGSGNVFSRRDFAPFGDELSAGTGSRSQSLKYDADAVRQKFTGKQRDNETNLDFFEARYYSSRWGRFTSPDEFTGGPEELIEFDGMLGHNPTFYAEPAEPQSLNKYQYALNNPYRYIDPDGHQSRTADILKVVIPAILTNPELVVPAAIGAGAALIFTTPSSTAPYEDPYSKAKIGNPDLLRFPLSQAIPSEQARPQARTIPNDNRNEKPKQPSEKQPNRKPSHRLAPPSPELGKRAKKSGRAIPTTQPKKNNTDSTKTKEHTKNARRSTKDKHTKTRSGQKQPPGFGKKRPKRPQDE